MNVFDKKMSVQNEFIIFCSKKFHFLFYREILNVLEMKMWVETVCTLNGTL